MRLLLILSLYICRHNPCPPTGKTGRKTASFQWSPIQKPVRKVDGAPTACFTVPARTKSAQVAQDQRPGPPALWNRRSGGPIWFMRSRNERDRTSAKNQAMERQEQRSASYDELAI